MNDINKLKTEAMIFAFLTTLLGLLCVILFYLEELYGGLMIMAIFVHVDFALLYVMLKLHIKR